MFLVDHAQGDRHAKNKDRLVWGLRFGNSPNCELLDSVILNLVQREKYSIVVAMER